MNAPAEGKKRGWEKPLNWVAEALDGYGRDWMGAGEGYGNSWGSGTGDGSGRAWSQAGDGDGAGGGGALPSWDAMRTGAGAGSGHAAVPLCERSGMNVFNPPGHGHGHGVGAKADRPTALELSGALHSGSGLASDTVPPCRYAYRGGRFRS